MELVELFRENTRKLECHLDKINQAECCCADINKSQCFLIVEIGRKPGISVKELADVLRSDKSVISRMVEDMVQKDYVERKASKEDRRFVTITLLPKGQERFEKIEHEMNARFKEVLDQIPLHQQKMVIDSLQLYNDACQKAEEKYREKCKKSKF